jgi:hypothetical protein
LEFLRMETGLILDRRSVSRLPLSYSGRPRLHGAEEIGADSSELPSCCFVSSSTILHAE